MVAQKLQQVFCDKFEVGASARQISASIGVCLIDNINSTADSILHFADTAMYRAKANWSFSLA
ncbi:MAG: diguanylate cyclase [Colwellia sp.]